MEREGKQQIKIKLSLIRIERFSYYHHSFPSLTILLSFFTKNTKLQVDSNQLSAHTQKIN